MEQNKIYRKNTKREKTFSMCVITKNECSSQRENERLTTSEEKKEKISVRGL